jgi:hypothetical protein
MSSDSNTTETFAQSVRRISEELATGKPLSSIQGTNGLSVESFAHGLKIKKGNDEVTIDTTAGLIVTSDGKTIAMQSTNSGGEMDAFKRHTQNAFVFGQTFRDNDDTLTVSATSRKTLVIFGEDKGNALLVSDFDDGTRGVAMFRDGTLSAAEYTMSPKPTQILDRDMSPLLTAKV